MKKLLALLISLVMLCTFISTNVSAATTTLKTPKITSTTVESNADVKIKWKKCKDASGYIIYRKSENTDYCKLAVVKKSGATSYTDIRAQYGTKYSYKLRTYKVKDGKKTYSKKSKAVTVYTKPFFTTFISAKLSSKKNIKLKWNAIMGVDGYAIYRKVGNDYKRIATIKSSDTESYTIKGLNVKKSYTFAIRSFYKKDGKNIYSKKSTIKFSNKKQVYPVIELNKKVKYHGFDVVFFIGDSHDFSIKHTLSEFGLGNESDNVSIGCSEYYDVKTKEPIRIFSNQKDTFLDNCKGLQDITNRIGKASKPAKIKK